MAKKCPPGKYYCFTDKKCKKIPFGYRIGARGYLARDTKDDDSETKKNGNGSSNGNGNGGNGAGNGNGGSGGNGGGNGGGGMGESIVYEKLDRNDKPFVKKLVGKLRKGSKTHAKQADDLEKAMKEEINVGQMIKDKFKKEGLSGFIKPKKVENKKTIGDLLNTLRTTQNEESNPRIPRKKGQPAKSKKHSDLYTDEDPKGTIHGLGFKDVAKAKASVSKIRNSSRSHAHKIQAAVAMEQRAREMGKTSEAAVYRKYINAMKKKTKRMNEAANPAQQAAIAIDMKKKGKKPKNVKEMFGATMIAKKNYTGKIPTEVLKQNPHLDPNNARDYIKLKRLVPKIDKAHYEPEGKLVERTMTSSEKRKDTMLKKKYDKSDMKKSMQKQYGKEEGKKVYFATIRKQAMSEEGLRDWFGKSSGTTKSGRKVRGWVQVGGKYDGKPCARQPGQKSTPKCVSSAKRRSMSKSERDSAARRKRAADPNQPQKSGAAKPTNVSTDPKKKMKEQFESQKSFSQFRGQLNEIDQKGLGFSLLNTTLNVAKFAKNRIGSLFTKKTPKIDTGTFQKVQNKSMLNKAKKYSRGEYPKIGGGNRPTLNTSKGDTPVKTEVSDTMKRGIDKMFKNGNNPIKKIKKDINKDPFEGGPTSKIESVVNEAKDKKGKGSGTKDACYHKVKSRYSVWPSAYASGALVKCRKVGAANWGNKTKKEGFSPMQITALEVAGMIELNEAGKKCWKGYEKKGTQTLFGKTYNRCVKKKSTKEEVEYTNEGIAFLKREKEKKKSSSEYLTQRDAGKLAKRKMAKKDQEKVNFLEPEETNESRTRLVKNGHTYKVVLTWRGKTYMIQMFVPSVSRPTRQQVEKEVQKVYPDAKLMSFLPKDLEPGEPTVMVGEDVERDEYGDPIGGPKISKKEKEKNLKKNEKDEDHTTTTAEEYVTEDDMKGMSVKSGHKRPTKAGAGMTQKGVEAYRRRNPGSKLKTAVTGKVKKGSKDAKRRKSYCARSAGQMKKFPKAAKDPNSRLRQARRRWKC